MALVATFYYNEVSLSLVLTTCQKLVSSNLARETVMEMADVLKDVAKNCMTRNKFNYPGILCLAKLLWLLAPPFHQSRGGLSQDIARPGQPELQLCAGQARA